MMTYKEIQKQIIKDTGVEVNNYCKFGCRMRTHAHVKERCVCKFEIRNSERSAFDLLHEIGHIYTYTTKMRRAESEYYATQWAIDKAIEYGFKVSNSTIEVYQRYIDRELSRGLKRGGSGYGDLTLVKDKEVKNNG